MIKKANTVILGLIVGCAVLAGVIQPRLKAMRTDISPNPETSLEDASPIVAFSTVALGGLRGLLIDMLWSRATELQDDRKYVEIVQLSDWVTKLEPRLDVVWDYHSFNMAYNISAMLHDPQDRWRWVSTGITMLRDEALLYNPDSVMLYDRLCRLYLHKLVETSDKAYPFYRMELAKEMNDLMAGPTPDSASEDQLERMVRDYRLDPEVIESIHEKYGRLDWRIGSSHVIYWATVGREHIGRDGQLGFDILVADGMSAAALWGRIDRFAPDSGILQVLPNFDLIPKTMNHFDQAIEFYKVEPGSDHVLATRYINFLRQAFIVVNDFRIPDLSDPIVVRLRKAKDPKSDLPPREYLEHLRTAPRLMDHLDNMRETALEEHHKRCHECQDHGDH